MYLEVPVRTVFKKQNYTISRLKVLITLITYLSNLSELYVV